MWNLLRVLPVLVVTGLGAYAIGGGLTTARAAGPKANACGCYRDTTGACFCGKKGKCDCPGECEPAGCEEKRAKELQKEVDAETKRAREAEKKQRAQDDEKRKKAEAVNNEEELAAEARAAAAAAADGAGGSGAAAGEPAHKAKGKAAKGKAKGKAKAGASNEDSKNEKSPSAADDTANKE